jgi:hypothetical protein
MHDPLQQVRQLQEALASDKIPLAFLIGAGCPVSVRIPIDGTSLDRPLIPDIEGLTQAVKERLQQQAKDGEALAALLSRVGGDANIESLLTQVRGLAQVVGEGAIDGMDAKRLTELDSRIGELISALVNQDLPPGDTAYDRLARWIAGIARQHPIVLFTTNYDLLLEQALENRRVPFFDGFVGSRRAFFDPASIDELGGSLPRRWTRLWKLHGSVNWWLTQQAGLTTVVRADHHETGQRRLIHPSHLKYEESRRMPYLAMIDRLRAFLRQGPAVLITSGYSYRDEHLNEVLAQGLEANPNIVCFALLHGRLDRYPKALRIASGHPHLSLMALDGGVLRSRRASWGVSNADSEVDKDLSFAWNGSGGSAKQLRLTLGDFGRFTQLLALALAAVPSGVETDS